MKPSMFMKPRNFYLRNVLYKKWLRAWKFLKPKFNSIKEFFHEYKHKHKKNPILDITIPQFLFLYNKYRHESHNAKLYNIINTYSNLYTNKYTIITSIYIYKLNKHLITNDTYNLYNFTDRFPRWANKDKDSIFKHLREKFKRSLYRNKTDYLENIRLYEIKNLSKIKKKISNIKNNINNQINFKNNNRKNVNLKINWDDYRPNSNLNTNTNINNKYINYNNSNNNINTYATIDNNSNNNINTSNNNIYNSNKILNYSKNINSSNNSNKYIDYSKNINNDDKKNKNINNSHNSKDSKDRNDSNVRKDRKNLNKNDSKKNLNKNDSRKNLNKNE
jgi:hypothetical protein